MKKFALILLSLILNSSINLAQQEWYWQNPKPQGNNLNAMSFINENEGWVVGDGWTILHTIDGGQTWEMQQSGIWNYNSTTSGLKGVSFVDENNGIAVGTEGIILRTIDGGQSWINQSSGTSNTLNAVSFTDFNNGAIAGNSGILLITNDGGSSWVNKAPSAFNSYSKITFVNANFGATVSIQDSRTYITTNGGTSWFQSLSFAASDIVFLSTNLGFASKNNSILKTIDGGITWNEYPVFSGTPLGIDAITFTDANTGTAVTAQGVFRTTDGGQNWIFQLAKLYPFRDAYFTDANNGTIVGDYGAIMRTTNGGQDWIDQLSNVIDFSSSGFSSAFWYLRDVTYCTTNTAFAVGDLWSILKTTDNGTTWVEQESGLTGITNSRLQGVAFTDEDTGIVVGVGRILRTTDGGQNWVLQATASGELFDVSFADANNGIAVGSNAVILKTTDAGISWTTQTSGVTGTLMSVSHVDVNNVLVVGASGRILKSTDGGSTWIQKTSGTTNQLNDVHFINENIAVVVGLSTIRKTTDGGETWSPQVYNGFTGLQGVYFSDNNNGIITGAGGLIIFTTDGGQNWLPAVSKARGGNHSINDVAISSTNKMIAVGQQAMILTSQGIAPINNNPFFVSPTPSCGTPFTIDVDHPFTFTVAAEDPDAGDVVSLSVSGLPSGSALNPVLPSSGNPVSSEFSWTPNLADVGNYVVTFEITDNKSAPVSCSFNIEVININTVPAFMEPTPTCGTTLSAYVGDEFAFTLSATDVDAGDVLSLTSGNLPSGSSMNPVLPLSGNPVSSQFSWTPDLVSVGTHTIIFEVTDNYSDPIYCSYTVEVINDNVAPTFISPTPACDSTLTADVGSPFSFTVSAEDANLGDVIVLASSSLPSGSSMDPVFPASGNPVSSLFSWTPTSVHVGLHHIVYTISDVQNYQSVCTLTVEVVNAPPPPQMPCPLSQGYWKNHTGDWPASAIPMMLGTTNNYDEQQLQSILNSAVRGDASIILAHQLIAAKLNVANGSPLPTEVSNAISDADAAIGTLEIPAGIKSNSSLRSTMISLATILDDYNNGLLTTDCTQMGKNGNGELEPVTEYALFSNYPNPFNPTTKITWQAPIDGHQTLKVFDVLGNEVAVLVDEFRPAGRYEATFDAGNLASGIYIYRLQAGDPSAGSGQSFIQTKKMILMK